LFAPVTKIAFLSLPLLALAACSSEPAAEPTAVPVPAATPSLPAPDQALFTRLHAEACPEAKPVNTAVCKRAGFGSEEVICEYGLGDDEYLRNKATLVPAEEEWALKDAAAICEPGAEAAPTEEAAG
jgi:hypothetical protein